VRRRALLISLAAAAVLAAVVAVVATSLGGSEGGDRPLHVHVRGICVDQGTYVAVQERVHNQGPAATFAMTAYARLGDGTVRRGSAVETAFQAGGYPLLTAQVPLRAGDRTPAQVGRYCGFEDVVLQGPRGGRAPGATQAHEP
jgi:hypothetical protein